jgi:uncharacterized protein (DUF736 family)
LRTLPVATCGGAPPAAGLPKGASAPFFAAPWASSRPDFRVQAGNCEIGAAWKKISKTERPYMSVTLDDPSFPATVYARLIEENDGTHNLIWSRNKPQVA